MCVCVRVPCPLVWNHLNVLFIAALNAESVSGILCRGLLVWHLGMDGIPRRRREEGDCLERRGMEGKKKKSQEGMKRLFSFPAERPALQGDTLISD